MRNLLLAGCALAVLTGCDAAEDKAAAPAEGADAAAQATSAQAVSAEAASDAAQPVADTAGEGLRGFGPPGDQTLDDMLQRSRAMFGRMDADGDGKVTEAEREAMRAQAGGPGGPGGPGRGMGGGMMGRADADGDGVITAAESEAQARARFERLDADKNGVVTAEERRAAFERRGGPPG